MAREVIRIPFDEFVTNPANVFERVIRENEAVVVEKEDSAITLKPLRTAKVGRRRRRKTAADYEAFRAAAGSWKDVDTDKLIADIYESRRRSSRPPVEL